jgi:uncharacterized protein
MEEQKTPSLRRGMGFSFLMGRRVKRQSMVLDRPIENQTQCQDCDGECCRSIPAMEISWEEFETLKALGATRLYFSLAGHHKFIIENGCEFLFRGKCSIYEARPDVCRRFICLRDSSTMTHPGRRPPAACRPGIVEPLGIGAFHI